MTSLGLYQPTLSRFAHLDALLAEFKKDSFRQRSEEQKITLINRSLLECLQSQLAQPTFLLPAVIEFIYKVSQAQILTLPYRLEHFELWLNHHSGCSPAENLAIRAAIVGKKLPREAYQTLFPIGNGALLPGAHIVTAHASPDLDTAVASFWGWVDAFGVRLSAGLHTWNHPTLEPHPQVRALFESYLGQGIWETLPTTTEKLELRPIDRVAGEACGTVSLRDFCNTTEIGLGPQLEIVSVIDHHKVALKTSHIPLMLIGDVQSCNVLTAELAFAINDAYRTTSGCFIHPHREYTEYMLFLQAILDDTDLLSKVTWRDLRCVAALLNRLKTLQTNQKSELLAFDPAEDLKQATQKVLQHPELYSIYQKIYATKEADLDMQLRRAEIFADTKLQNGCCRIGQTKLFARNLPTFMEVAENLRAEWLRVAQAQHQAQREVQLHLHMISTVASADEMYTQRQEAHAHADEMWIWIPEQADAFQLLEKYLRAFQASPGVTRNELHIEFYGSDLEKLQRLFSEAFLPIPHQFTHKEKSPAIAILRFRAGSMNSRKATVTPYLPTL